ncbi:MAG: hypothetical protein V1678_01185 [Candidatus Aenigmatarchaeota archaeon]
MSKIVESKNTRGGLYVEIEGESALYIAPETAGKVYSALVKIKEEGDNYRGKVKTEFGNTKIELHDTGWFSRELTVEMISTEFPSYINKVSKSVELSKLPDIIETLGDYIDQKAFSKVGEEKVNELRRLYGNKIKL